MKIRNYLVFGGGQDAAYVSKKIYGYRKRIFSAGGVIKKLYNLFYEDYLKRNACSIPISAELGDNIVFPHLSGIFISCDAKIGNNCVIFQQVTIGSNTLLDSKKTGSPTIGDNCYIGCGAKIIGSVHIGNNVRIGANCIVVNDVPDNATIVSQTPILINHNEPRNNSFNTLDDCKKV